MTSGVQLGSTVDTRLRVSIRSRQSRVLASGHYFLEPRVGHMSVFASLEEYRKFGCIGKSVCATTCWHDAVNAKTPWRFHSRFPGMIAVRRIFGFSWRRLLEHAFVFSVILGSIVDTRASGYILIIVVILHAKKNLQILPGSRDFIS